MYIYIAICCNYFFCFDLRYICGNIISLYMLIVLYHSCICSMSPGIGWLVLHGLPWCDSCVVYVWLV